MGKPWALNVDRARSAGIFSTPDHVALIQSQAAAAPIVNEDQLRIGGGMPRAR